MGDARGDRGVPGAAVPEADDRRQRHRTGGTVPRCKRLIDDYGSIADRGWRARHVMTAGIRFGRCGLRGRTATLGLTTILACGSAAGGDEPAYYFGADLSYVNELENCGATYSLAGKRRDPFELLHERGASLVRVRLWNDADWTRYSNLADVKKTIAAPPAMEVLLNFQLSDNWADGDKQIIPRAWKGIKDTDALAEALYEFTRRTLQELDGAGLMPELVQVERDERRDPEHARAGQGTDRLGAQRQATQCRHQGRARCGCGVAHQAARDAAHRAARERRAVVCGCHRRRGDGLRSHRRQLLPQVVEAGSRWSRRCDQSSASPLRRRRAPGGGRLSVDARQRRHLPQQSWRRLADPRVSGHPSQSATLPARPEPARDRQRRRWSGLWEPAWISSSCKTRWGSGSGWDNATLFDFEGALLPGADYLDHPYVYPVEVEFRADPVAKGDPVPLYLWGDFLGEGMEPLRFDNSRDASVFQTRLMPGQRIRYPFTTRPTAVSRCCRAMREILTVWREPWWARSGVD